MTVEAQTGGWPLALARAFWRSLRAGLADIGLAAPPPGRTLAEATRHIREGSFTEADGWLERYLHRLEDGNEDALELYAISAHNAGRYEVALSRWRRLREHNPGRSDAWVGMAANAREMGRLELARSIVNEAASRFPDDVVMMTEALRVSEAQGRTGETVAWCEAIVSRLPHDSAWWLRYVDRLMDAHDFPAAVAVAQRAVISHPDHHPLSTRLLVGCRLASDFKSALQELTRLHERSGGTAAPADMLMTLFGTDADMVQWVLWHAINDGSYVLAGDIAAIAPARFPTDARFRFETARLAFVREDWVRVVELLDGWSESDAGETRAREMVGFARMNLDGSATGAGRTAAQACASAADPKRGKTEDGKAEDGSAEHVETAHNEPDDGAADLLRDFESVGVDCEFGLLQRQWGVEPLGLTRWMGVTAVVLAAMVDVDFEGLGSIETSRLTMRTSGEYFFTDTRYAFEYHTWMYRHEVEAEDLLKRMRRHVSFLKRLFLDELRTPTRILVLKTFGEDLTQVRRLHRALRRHGPCSLLWVRSASNDPGLADEVGRVREIEGGLYAAALSGFGNRIGEWEIQSDEWLAICRQARDLRHASGSVSGLAARDAAAM